MAEAAVDQTAQGPDPGQVAAEVEALSNTQRAAVMLMLLGEEEAANVIRHLAPKEVQHLSAAMISVADLSQEAVSVVLDGFIATIKKQTNLGGGIDYLEAVLKQAIGEDKASSVLSRIMPASANRGLEVLQWMDARSITEMIADEHPQIIAIVLSFLDYDVAADVLRFLPEHLRPEVLGRVASLETIQPTAMQELEAIMRQQFSSNSSLKSSSVGGVKAAAKIMNFVKSDIEQGMMKTLTERNGDLAQRIQDNMIAFENLSGCDNRSIQTLMRAVPSELLMVALKGADDLAKDKFLSNMSARAREMFVDEMEARGPLRLSDVEDAQKQILRTARRLSDAGEMMLAGRGADYV
ncbi:MAG: flagellar motor switch protein FliG [Steroidobacteraceae bacterium]|jgi:flagellar motor switch protein FliG|nr:flagellar motor switch protein FliG [Gammaproteobacteria bacterium]